MIFLAHSAGTSVKFGNKHTPTTLQTWCVMLLPTLSERRSIRQSFGELLRAAVRLAAEFHDLGKLRRVNQEVLRTNHGKMLNHVDAGRALSIGRIAELSTHGGCLGRVRPPYWSPCNRGRK